MGTSLIMDLGILAITFGAGLLSFFAPCILPVLPGYLAFVTGGPAVGRGVHLVRTAAFVLGFAAAFTVLGALVGAIGTLPAFHSAETVVRRIGGAVIIVFGLHMTGLLRLSFLERDLRFHGDAPAGWHVPRVVVAAVLGAAFAIGWSPCVGPILASILVLAGVQGGVAGGALLLAVYSAGLSVPFLILGASAEKGALLLRRFRKTGRWIELVGGILLVGLGVLVFAGQLARFLSLIV